eukprot:CAMPEP_0172868694 /NCGR_PEP_ID=MMETSP1075-20121228/86985_1 /TAXON_ID=2916 /ORGANISM="Ceratium fusus, Strain PA161109" /LENGTH=244 /DNA_ID=CAMNT_0013718391 /DNA_START=53 /DNA_END=784 /DNA_ORIENTATION=+
MAGYPSMRDNGMNSINTSAHIPPAGMETSRLRTGPGLQMRYYDMTYTDPQRYRQDGAFWFAHCETPRKSAPAQPPVAGQASLPSKGSRTPTTTGGSNGRPSKTASEASSSRSCKSSSRTSATMLPPDANTEYRNATAPVIRSATELRSSRVMASRTKDPARKIQGGRGISKQAGILGDDVRRGLMLASMWRFSSFCPLFRSCYAAAALVLLPARILLQPCLWKQTVSREVGSSLSHVAVAAVDA